VRLAAEPALGYRFGDFAGDGDCADGRLTMDAVKDCIARFVALPPPATPTGFAATPQALLVQLRWDAVNGPVIRYTIERATSGSAVFTQLAGLDGTSADFIDGGVEHGTMYQYRLIAHNASGASQPAFVSATTLVPGPSLLTVSISGAGTVTSNPPGISCGADCSEFYGYGAIVTLVAVAEPGHSAGMFGGDADCSDGSVMVTRAITCTVTFVPVPPPPTPGWHQVGPALTDRSGVPPIFSMVLDEAAIRATTVAYVEASPPTDVARLYVKRWSGSAWEMLGAGALNAGSATAATDPSLATRFASPLHVAWSQGNGLQQNIFVARFNGTAWESVGPAGVPLNYVAGSRAIRPSLAFDRDGLPIVAWIENGAVKFKRFDGTHWVPALGGEGPPSSNADRVELSFGPFAPVLAWTEGGGSARALKVTYGFLFVPFGNQLNAPLAPGRTLSDFGVRAEQDSARVMWAEGPNPFSIFAQRWDGLLWSDDFSPLVADLAQPLASFAMSRSSSGSGSLAAAYSSVPSGGTPTVETSERGPVGWFAHPTFTLPGPALRDIEIVVLNSGNPVIAGQRVNEMDLYELRVFRLFQ
jgi:hypothetical protein